MEIEFMSCKENSGSNRVFNKDNSYIKVVENGTSFDTK